MNAENTNIYYLIKQGNWKPFPQRKCDREKEQNIKQVQKTFKIIS